MVRGRISESGFQNSITELATLRGWLWYHTYDSRRSPPGFPDLVLVRGSCLLFRELKLERMKVTSEQRVWLDALTACGADAKVWRPGDWPVIEQTLKEEGR